MAIINVKSIKYLLDLYEKQKKSGTPVEAHDFSTLELLIKDKKDTAAIDLINRDDYVATKLWQEEDFINTANELLDEIPQILNDKLPIHKEIEDIAISAAVNGMADALSDCTDDDWDIIRHIIEQELTDHYSEKYNRNLKVRIKITYPDKTEKETPTYCDELTHRIICTELTDLFTKIDNIHTPHDAFKFCVLKPITDEEINSQKRITYPLYHLDDITEEMLQTMTHEQQARIYYTE